MEIREINDENFQKKWDKFVMENSSPSSFLQSWTWGKFRQSLGEKVKYYTIYSTKTLFNNKNIGQAELVATALIIKKKLPLARYYWECPRGPVILNSISKNEDKKEILESLVGEINKTAKQEQIIFFRIEPPYDEHDLQVMIPGLMTPQILVHSKNPNTTLLLDLTKSEEEILADMHHKCRYNIRLAEKKGVIVKSPISNSKSQIDNFYNLLQETAQRDGIKIFSKKYYQSLIDYFNYSDQTGTDLKNCLFFSEYQNKVLAAIMVMGFGDTATYLHGGSANNFRDVMPNYATQWAAIRWAKKQGYHWYDFWGIALQTPNDKNQATNSWLGITRFKRGFIGEKTGREINYVGALDFIINNKWLNLYKVVKMIIFS